MELEANHPTYLKAKDTGTLIILLRISWIMKL